MSRTRQQGSNLTWGDGIELERLSINAIAEREPPTPQEELRLLDTMVRGRNEKKRLGITDTRTPADVLATLEHSVRGTIVAGELAYDELILRNGRLVVKIAMKWRGRGLGLNELCQEGMMGLMRSLQLFNPELNVRLSTYATMWIKQRIRRAANSQAETIRIPVHASDKRRKVLTVRDKLMARQNKVTRTDIAKETGLTLHDVNTALSQVSVTHSLDEQVGNDGDSFLGDMFSYENNEDPDYEIDMDTLRLEIDKMLSELPPRSAQVISHRYGLNGNTQLSLKEAAVKFGLTKERVRQIENETLTRIRRGIYHNKELRMMLKQYHR